MKAQLLLSVWLVGVAGCVNRPEITTIEQPRTSKPVAREPAGTDLNLQSLIALVNQIYPNRDYAASYSYHALWIDFRHFGITTVEEAQKIILVNRDFAEAEEAKWQALYGKNRSREDGGVPSETARSYNYNCVGMARHALRKHVGEEAFIEYEMKEKPNKAPEPTPLPVMPPAEPGVTPGSVVAHL